MQPQIEGGRRRDARPPTRREAIGQAGAGGPRAVYDAPRQASRHAFNQDLQIQIDGSATQLVDLVDDGRAGHLRRPRSSRTAW